MPFGGAGGAQVTVALRGWSLDTVGVSTAPGPGSEEELIVTLKTRSLTCCVLTKARGERDEEDLFLKKKKKN